MIVIGLVGGICAGKSSVIKHFESHGHRVVDADKLGHQAYAIDTDCYNDIVKHFGEAVVNPEDRSINRKALGAIVFGGDKSKMRELESIVWPHIHRMLSDIIRTTRAETVPPVQVLVIEAAIMLEAGWQSLVDQVWVLEAAPSIAIQRLMARNSLTLEESEKRLASQNTNEWRRGFATVVITNNQGPAELKEECDRFISRLTATI